MGSSCGVDTKKETRVMFTAGFILLIAGCCGLIQASDVETRSAPVADNNGNHAEIQQMIDMMKNYKNRLFLANHGKRSVIEPSEGIEEADDDIMTSEELSELTFSTHPNSFFFLPMPAYKRASNQFPRPNGFMFPVGVRRALGMNKRAVRLNPNGFNFPIGKRSAPELDLDGNFYGNRGKRYTFTAARGKRDSESSTENDAESGDVSPYMDGTYFVTTRG